MTSTSRSHCRRRGRLDADHRRRDLKRAADLLRPSLALYIEGMGTRGVTYHHEVFAPMGYEARPTIQDHYLAGDKKAGIAAVPTAMVEDVTLIGFWARIADKIQCWQRPSSARSASAATCVTWVKSPASCGVDVGAVQYYEALTWQWW